jgi:hypothetical protein
MPIDNTKTENNRHIKIMKLTISERGILGNFGKPAFIHREMKKM